LRWEGKVKGDSQYGERVEIKTSRKFRDAAVNLMRTWFGPGAGTSNVFLVRSVTFDAVEGIDQALFWVGVDIVILQLVL
jgi:hypothetical protein